MLIGENNPGNTGQMVHVSKWPDSSVGASRPAWNHDLRRFAPATDTNVAHLDQILSIEARRTANEAMAETTRQLLSMPIAIGDIMEP
jgi:hypothetical protein